MYKCTRIYMHIIYVCVQCNLHCVVVAVVRVVVVLVQCGPGGHFQRRTCLSGDDHHECKCSICAS